jgi:hypothetical protein
MRRKLLADFIRILSQSELKFVARIASEVAQERIRKAKDPQPEPSIRRTGVGFSSKAGLRR